MTGLRMLSVDWDWFFPETKEEAIVIRDWGHTESELFIHNEDLWTARAAGCLLFQGTLPGTSGDRFSFAAGALPGTSGEELTFWDRFSFAAEAELFVAESHSLIVADEVLSKIPTDSEIISFDAHHDCGYKGRDPVQILTGEETQDCTNWVIYYALNGIAEVEVIYPKWKDWAFSEARPSYKASRRFDSGAKFKKAFDYVFICRSGAWVPPWLDDKFEAFVDRCPVKAKNLLPFGGHSVLAPRRFDPDKAHAIAEEGRQKMPALQGLVR